MTALIVETPYMKMKECVLMSRANQKFFNKAKQAALVSDYPRIHVGCIAVYQGNIIGIGCNTNKTHPSQQYYNRFRNNGCIPNYNFQPKMHAEINCINGIRHMDINFTKTKLYVYRIRIDREYGMSRPCPSCMAAIRDLGIRDIYYTTNDGFACERLGPLQGGVA